MTMADQIAVMNHGRIEQLGTPTELYETPATAFVAGFLGVSNLIPGTVSGTDTVQLRRGPEVRVRADALRGKDRGGRDRDQAREDRARGGAGKHARREGRRAGVRRGRNAIHRRNELRPADRLPAKCIAGPERSRAGPTAHAQLEPRLHLRRRLTGGIRMTDSLTRLQLLRRAAAGGAFLTLPGVLAACGGSSKSAATTSGGEADARQDAPLLELDALHRHEQQDAHASVARRVPEEVRRPTFSTPRTSTTTPPTSGRSRARSRAANRSTATSSS